MSRRCELTGKGVMSGHLVSHANNKKKRVFRPNLQTVTLASDTLGQAVSLKVSMNALRSVVSDAEATGSASTVASACVAEYMAATVTVAVVDAVTSASATNWNSEPVDSRVCGLTA